MFFNNGISSAGWENIYTYTHTHKYRVRDILVELSIKTFTLCMPMIRCLYVHTQFYTQKGNMRDILV